MSVRALRIISLLSAVMLTLLSLTNGQSPSPPGLPVTYERLLKAPTEPGNWLTYGGDYRSHHYSSLNQITRRTDAHSTSYTRTRAHVNYGRFRSLMDKRESRSWPWMNCKL